MDPRQIVTDMAFRIEPELLGVDLASPWRRAAALLADLMIAGVVAGLGAPGVVGCLMAGVAYRVLTGSGRRRFAFFRSMGGAFGAMVVFAFTYGALSSNGGRSDVQVATTVDAQSLALMGSSSATTSASTASIASRHEELGSAVANVIEAFSGNEADAQKRGEEAEAIAKVVGEIAASVEASRSDENLQKRIARLSDENDELKEQLAAPSMLRSVRALAGDLGLTFGWVGAYFTLFLAWWNGFTPGKRLFNIRVCRLDGQPFSLWMAFERFAGYAAGLATGLLGFFQIFWDANRQGIHDKISGTVVVRMATNGEPRRNWWRRNAR